MGRDVGHDDDGTEHPIGEVQYYSPQPCHVPLVVMVDQ